MKKLLLILISIVISSFYAQNDQHFGNFTSNSAPLYLEMPVETVLVEAQTSNSLENVVPPIFVKYSFHSNKAINFKGSSVETEVYDNNEVSNTFYLTGIYHDQFTIETDLLFDTGFSLQTLISTQKDHSYMSYEPWGLDYLNEFATVTDFNIEIGYREYGDDVYEVDRNASVSGEVKGNINLFRHLFPEDLTLNVTAYSFVNFLATNNQPLEIIIMPKEDRDWNNRMRYTIPINIDEKEYCIPFSDFLDKDGNSIEINNIKTIVFSIIGDYVNYMPFDFSIKDVGFKVSSVLNINDFTEEEDVKLLNYPNPFSDLTTIQLTKNSEFVHIKVFDILGRVVDFKKIYLESLKRKVQYRAPQLKSGIYKYALKGDNSKLYTGTFIIK